MGLIQKIRFRMLTLPIERHAVPNEAGRAGKTEAAVVPSQNFFREYSGKVLTEKNENVSLETFPSLGSGSLKFTLCD